MVKKAIKILVVVIVAMLAISLLLIGVAVRNGLGVSEGRFLRADNGSTLLLDDHGATVLSAQRDGMFDNLNNGDKILVIHDGIAESYPARTGAFFCFLQERGSEKDLPENVMDSLRELGWIAVEIIEEPDIGYEIPFSAQYIRTNGDLTNVPTVSLITSAQQLQEYYEAHKDAVDLERKENVYVDTTVGFLDACDKYDEKFFSSNKLLFVTLEWGSGSIRHEVLSVAENAVYIQSIVPEIGTCDMAQWHIIVEIPASLPMGPAEDISVFMDGKNITEKINTAKYTGRNSNISLNIPEGWEYEINTCTAEGLSCGISFWPKGENSGKVSVRFISDAWGVCGTFLRTEETVIGQYPVSIGYYGGRAEWDYIYFYDTPGTYVVQREGQTDWWEQHADKVMEILSTIKVAEGYVSRSDAIAIASEKLDKEQIMNCEDIWTDCDIEKGVWHIEFYRNSDHYATISVDVDLRGNILEIPE